VKEAERREKDKMNYQLIDGKVTSDDGKIAVQHASVNPTNMMIEKVPYIFTPRHNVCLSWIQPQHLDKILSVKGKGS
jgi:hypothetical protein